MCNGKAMSGIFVTEKRWAGYRVPQRTFLGVKRMSVALHMLLRRSQTLHGRVGM